MIIVAKKSFSPIYIHTISILLQIIPTTLEKNILDVLFMFSIYHNLQKLTEAKTKLQKLPLKAQESVKLNFLIIKKWKFIKNTHTEPELKIAILCH